MQHVILGAGPAGVTAAETLRKVDPESEITLVIGEDGAPYSRMAIPYILTGKIDEAGADIRKTKGHFDALGITLVHGQVEKVSTKNSTVVLAGGAAIPFDRVLVATGSRPIAPPIPGLDLAGVRHCWTKEDARAIAEKAKKGSDVVLMGAGFIGCIILESLVERGVNLTVIEAEDRMIPKMMDKVGGDMLKRWCESKGLAIKTSTKVTGIVEKGERLSVGLDGGGAPDSPDSLDADLVVIATGVAPNADFLDGSGVDVGRGIYVNEHLESTVAGIFAAGDVAEGPDFLGGFMVHAVQPTAVEHGRIAALNMAGKNAPYQGSLIMNVLDTLGLVTASFGHWDGGSAHAKLANPDGFRYTNLAFEDNKLTGALTVGRIDHVGALRGLIQKGQKLGGWEETLKKNPDRIMDAFVALSQ